MEQNGIEGARTALLWPSKKIWRAALCSPPKIKGQSLYSHQVGGVIQVCKSVLGLESDFSSREFHFSQALNKKEQKGGQPGSPDCGDSDGEGDASSGVATSAAGASTVITPSTEEKYNKVDEQFQLMLQQRASQARSNGVGSDYVTSE